MMRFTSCFMPPGGAADIVDDGGADLYRVLAQKMPAAMLRPTSARSLWPSLSYTAGAPTATVSWARPKADFRCSSAGSACADPPRSAAALPMIVTSSTSSCENQPDANAQGSRDG